MNVLIIEDDEHNMYLARFLLEAEGHNVVGVSDAKSGIEQAQQRDFDIVLLDIQLPDMNGHDVARRLNKLPKWNHAPIVAVTSFALPGDREEALAAGCAAYLEKPINTDRFVAQINSIMKDRSA